MKKVEFDKLLKKYKKDLQEILRLYCTDKIFLTSKQIEKVIRLRGERKYPYYEIKKGRQVMKNE